jgi:peptide/nickel transport system substrate-binding protein
MHVLKFNMNRAPINDVRFRQAVQLGINRQEILDKVFSGAATLTGPIPTGFGDWAPPVDELKANPWYTQDQARARQLLKDAGIPDGQQIDFLVTAGFNEYHVPIATVIAEQMKQIGLNFKLRQVEQGEFIKEENPPVNSFDIDIGGFSPRHDPDGYLWQRFYSDGGKNDFANAYQNPKVDDLLRKGRTTTDPKQRKAIYDEVQPILIEDAPNIWLAVDSWMWGIRDFIKGGYVESPFGFRRDWGIAHAWLDK